MEINTLADMARNDISDYCINECKAFCCSKGILVLTKDELFATFGDDEDEIEANKQYITEQKDGRFALELSRGEKGCPSLDEHKMCKIHKSSRRSKTRSDFPIFIKEKQIFISPRCFAHVDRKFYAFRYQAEEMSYEIVTENPFDE